MRLPCGFFATPQREPGGRGRIRTFVARKERQIYSLLVLATHPPVPQNLLGRELRVPNLSFNNLRASHAKTQKGLVSRDTSPFAFQVRIRSALAPLQNSWWSWRRELNPRPSDYKSDALPAELRQRRSNRVRIAEGVSELQGGVREYLARGWPALWKIAFPLITCTPVILSVIYSLAWNPPGRSSPNPTTGNSTLRSVFR